MLKSLLRKTINVADRLLGLRQIMREGNSERGHLLAGDRAIEWSWVVTHLPTKASRILDLGCVQSVLTGISARLGHKVTAVDLRDIEYEMPNVTFHKKNILDLDLAPSSFDVIMNCSMIEHVGLKDRYGSMEFPDGDLIAMQRLSEMLAEGGKMILTIPAGLDGEFAPFHRVYGAERLPRLLEHYRIVEEEYWHKGQNDKWIQCDKQTALNTQGSFEFYALGLFLVESGYLDRGFIF